VEAGRRRGSNDGERGIVERGRGVFKGTLTYTKRELILLFFYLL